MKTSLNFLFQTNFSVNSGTQDFGHQVILVDP